jgi:HSP20 family protein
MLMTYLPKVDFQIDRLFDEALRSVSGDVAWAPACNAYEDEQGFWVEASLPGMDPNDIELQVEDGVLTVRGERKGLRKEGATHYISELTAGKFSRCFALPSSVDPHKASASYRNGILTVQFPKSEEAKPRRIMIEAK